MAEMWKPQPWAVYRSWVDGIIDEAQSELSDWESGFVDSISNWLASGKLPTKAQAETLERIYSEKTK